MTSWHEGTPERRSSTAWWFDFLLIIALLPVMFFALDALLSWIAGWFA